MQPSRITRRLLHTRKPIWTTPLSPSPPKPRTLSTVSPSTFPPPPGRGREIAMLLARERSLGMKPKDEIKSTTAGTVASMVMSAGIASIVVAVGYVVLTEDGREWISNTLFTSNIPGAAIVYDNIIKPFSDPVREKLLPDFPEFPPGQQAPRTVIVDLENTLCHLEWDQKYGWRTVKRPNVDLFLTRVALAGYEVVIFSTGNGFFLEPIALALDPRGMVSHRLFRDSTKFTGTKHIKDLSRLNRDLRNVVAIDDDPAALEYNLDSAIIIRPFVDKNDVDDHVLLDLIPLLEDFAIRDVKDVRTELARLRGLGNGDPIKGFQKIVAETQAQRELAQHRGLAQVTGGISPLQRHAVNPALKKGLGS